MLALGRLALSEEDDDAPAATPTDPRDLLGAAAAFKRAAERAAGPQVFYLWPEHTDALRVWLALQTQWRHRFGGPTGLDYAAIEAWFRITREPARAERLAELQLMERAALRAWADDRARG